MLALQAEGASRLSSQFLCRSFSWAPSLTAVATPRRAADLPLSQLRAVVTLLRLFSSVFVPLARAATRHVSLQSQKSRQGTAEEGSRRGKRWRLLAALLCPGTASGGAESPPVPPMVTCPRGLGRTSAPSPSAWVPAEAQPCPCSALPAALPARPRPRREVWSSCSALYAPAQHPAARTCCSLTVQ